MSHLTEDGDVANQEPTKSFEQCYTSKLRDLGTRHPLNPESWDEIAKEWENSNPNSTYPKTIDFFSKLSCYTPYSNLRTELLADFYLLSSKQKSIAAIKQEIPQLLKKLAQQPWLRREDFYKYINNALSKQHGSHVKLTLREKIPEALLDDATQFINNLSSPDRALAYLKSYIEKDFNSKNQNLAKLYAYIEASKLSDYQKYIAYACLPEAFASHEASNQNHKPKNSVDGLNSFIHYLEMEEEYKKTQYLEKTTAIRDVNNKVNKKTKFILPWVGIFSGFLALEVLRGIADHALYDTATHLGYGPTGDAMYATVVAPLIFLFAIIVGIAFNFYYHYSSKEGAKAYYLEKYAAEHEVNNKKIFGIDNVTKKANKQSNNKLGFWYWLKTRSTAHFLPFLGVLGMGAAFELIVFEMLEYFFGIHEILSNFTIADYGILQIGGNIFPLMPILLAGFAFATYKIHGKEHDLLKPFVYMGLAISLFTMVMPVLGIEFSGTAMVYFAALLAGAVCYNPLLLAEKGLEVYMMDNLYLEERESERLENEVLLQVDLIGENALINPNINAIPVEEITPRRALKHSYSTGDLNPPKPAYVPYENPETNFAFRN